MVLHVTYLYVDSVTEAMLLQLDVIFAIVSTAVQLVAGSDTSSDVETSLWQPSYVVSLVSICSIVCIIIVIVACAKWCPRETAEFQVIFIVFYCWMDASYFINNELIVWPL